jgi:hypothetical protein
MKSLLKRSSKLGDRDIYRTVYTESLKNAEQYVKDAEVLIKLKRYNNTARSDSRSKGTSD